MDWAALKTQCLPASNQTALPPQIKLPALPTVVLQFAKLADNPHATNKQLGQLIETDSTLTCELLKYSNSAAFAARSKIATAQHAIARLGIRATKVFLLSTAVEQTMKASKSRLINIQNLWLTNLERALFAKEIARKLKTDVDVAYAGSLLQDCLLPVLSNERFDLYMTYLQRADSRQSLVECEQQKLGWDHALATGLILSAWGFPDDLICCVCLHHKGLAMLQSKSLGNTPVAAVAVAALLPDPLRQSPGGLPLLMELDAIWPDFRLAETAATISRQLHELTPLAAQHSTLERRLSHQLSAV